MDTSQNILHLLINPHLPLHTSILGNGHNTPTNTQTLENIIHPIHIIRRIRNTHVLIYRNYTLQWNDYRTILFHLYWIFHVDLEYDFYCDCYCFDSDF